MSFDQIFATLKGLAPNPFVGHGWEWFLFLVSLVGYFVPWLNTRRNDDPRSDILRSIFGLGAIILPGILYGLRQGAAAGIVVSIMAAWLAFWAYLYWCGVKKNGSRVLAAVVAVPYLYSVMWFGEFFRLAFDQNHMTPAARVSPLGGRLVKPAPNPKKELQEPIVPPPSEILGEPVAPSIKKHKDKKSADKKVSKLKEMKI